MRFKLIGLLALYPAFTFGQDLIDIYQMAATTDPTFNITKAQTEADKQQFGLALGDVVPNVTSSGNYKTVKNVELYPNTFNQYNWTMSLNQTVFSGSKFSQLQQSRLVRQRIPADLKLAEQSLVFRITNKYFDILKAADAVTFNEQKKAAFLKQWQQTEERYKVGIVPITDVHEARARLDAATASTISVQNTLNEKYQALSESTGEKIDAINPLQSKPDLKRFDLAPIATYEAQVQSGNPALQQAEYNTKIAKKQIWEKRSGHLPSVDAFANLSYDKTVQPGSDHQYTRTVGLKATWDLFSGGKINAATHQKQALYQEEKAHYRKVYLETMSDIRQSYYAIHNQIAQVNALEQAVVSHEAALKAIRTAYEVGSRRLTDVLDAETALLEAKQALKAAYYDLLLADLALKQALGSLTATDLEYINALLKT